jgi:GTP-binding protein HflX
MKELKYINQEEKKILIIGLTTPQNYMLDQESYFEEFKKLVTSNFITPTGEYFSKLRSIDPSTFLTKGKLEEVKKICLDNEIEEVIFSEKLSPHQEMKLEKILHATVYDRTHLILEIFEKQAQTEEAKIQIKIAFLNHKKTRVAGQDSHFSQQAGRVGIISGAGETQKELDLQHIDHLLQKLNRDLERIEQTKKTQRKERIKNNTFSISIIGYTNSGKSTLFNTLTKSSILAEDKLFATLDTTTRELFIADDLKNKIIITDTVGFIQNIPHQLIASFKNTLSEIDYSSLLIHLIDISNRDWANQYKTVIETIKEITSKEIAIINVYNKIDALSEEKIQEIKDAILLKDPNALFISAKNKQTLSELLTTIQDKMRKK